MNQDPLAQLDRFYSQCAESAPPKRERPAHYIGSALAAAAAVAILAQLLSAPIPSPTTGVSPWSQRDYGQYVAKPPAPKAVGQVGGRKWNS